MARKRITLDLDPDLLQALDAQAAESGTSRNQFVARAVKRLLRELERLEVDRAFEGMAEDTDYQSRLLRLEAEMAPASDASWAMIQDAEERADCTWEVRPAPK